MWSSLSYGSLNGQPINLLNGVPSGQIVESVQGPYAGGLNGHLPVPADTPASVVAAPLPNNVNGKTIIHNPKPIIIRRPPTKIQINHPPIVVKPAPVAFHKPPAKVYRPIIVKNLPPSYQIVPEFKKVYGPVQKKIIYNQAPPCEGQVYN